MKRKKSSPQQFYIEKKVNYYLKKKIRCTSNSSIKNFLQATAASQASLLFATSISSSFTLFYMQSLLIEKKKEKISIFHLKKRRKGKREGRTEWMRRRVVQARSRLAKDICKCKKRVDGSEDEEIGERKKRRKDTVIVFFCIIRTPACSFSFFVVSSICVSLSAVRIFTSLIISYNKKIRKN